MRNRIVFFVLGCLVTSLFWYGIARYIHRPKDRTTNIASDLRKDIDQSPFAFLKNAYADVYPGLTVFRPFQNDKMIAYVQIGPPEAQNSIMIWDSDLNGVHDSLVLMDSARRSLMTTVNDSNGKWSNWTFTSNSNTGPSYSDMNMDGQPDLMSVSSNSTTRVFFKGAWQDLQREGKNNYIVVDGRKTEFNPQEYLKEIQVKP